MLSPPSYFDENIFRQQQIDKAKQRETVIFAQEFSPDGECLVCGTNFGCIEVFRLTQYLNEDYWQGVAVGTNTKYPKPMVCINAHSGSIYDLEFVKTSDKLYVVSGADGEIRGWNWFEILKLIENNAWNESINIGEPQYNSFNWKQLFEKIQEQYSQLIGDKNFINSINLDNKSVNFIGNLDYLHYHNICDDKLRKWGADIDSIDSYVNIDDGIYMACKSVIKNN